MLTVAIVEDSRSDRVNLEKYLDRYMAETQNVIIKDVFDRAELFLQNYKPVYDVVFMDICLPYMNGMDAAEQLRKLDGEVAIIFVTDMAQYALRGYRVNALDYFVKPVTYYDLKLRMDKLCMLSESKQASVVIHIPCEGSIVVSSRDVKYIEVMNKQLTYHTTKGNFEARGAGLKKLAADLCKSGFGRCSSSYLVNLKWCEEIRGDAVSVGGEWLKISRGMKREFVTRLSESLTSANLRGGVSK